MPQHTHTHLRLSVSTRERRLLRKEGDPEAHPIKPKLTEIPAKELNLKIEDRKTQAQTLVEEVATVPRPKNRYWQSATPDDTITVQRPGRDPLTIKGKMGETVKIRDQEKGVTVKIWHDPSGKESDAGSPWQYQVILLGSSPQDPAGQLDCTVTSKNGGAAEFLSLGPQLRPKGRGGATSSKADAPLPATEELPLPLLDITPALPEKPARRTARPEEAAEEREERERDEDPPLPLLDITPALPEKPARLTAESKDDRAETPEEKEGREQELKRRSAVLEALLKDDPKDTDGKKFDTKMTAIFGTMNFPYKEITVTETETSFVYDPGKLPIKIVLTDVKTEDLESALLKKAEEFKEKINARKQELCKLGEGYLKEWHKLIANKDENGEYQESNYSKVNISPAEGLALQVRRGVYAMMDVRAFGDPDNALSGDQEKAFHEALRLQASDVIGRGNDVIKKYDKARNNWTYNSYLSIANNGTFVRHKASTPWGAYIDYEALNTEHILEKPSAEEIAERIFDYKDGDLKKLP